jgi:hypothetical protein
MLIYEHSLLTIHNLVFNDYTNQFSNIFNICFNNCHHRVESGRIQAKPKWQQSRGETSSIGRCHSSSSTSSITSRVHVISRTAHLVLVDRTLAQPTRPKSWRQGMSIPPPFHHSTILPSSSRILSSL